MMPGKNRSHQLYGKILKADKKEHTPVHIYCSVYPITKSLQVVLTLVLKKEETIGSILRNLSFYRLEIPPFQYSPDI
jgi:hypothetical protein